IGAANGNSDPANTIIVPAGQYHLTLRGVPEDNNLSGDLDIHKSVTILAADGASVDGGGFSSDSDGPTCDRVFDIKGDFDVPISVTLSGLSISGGFVQGVSDGEVQGGGIRVFANATEPAATRTTLTMTNCAVSYNTVQASTKIEDETRGGSALGGGIYASGAYLSITNTVVSNNIAAGGAAEGEFYGDIFGGSASGGGLCQVGAAATLIKTTFSQNHAIGGPAYMSGNFNAYGGAGMGGGLLIGSSSFLMTDSEIDHNEVSGGRAESSGVGQDGTFGDARGGDAYGGGLDSGPNSSCIGCTFAGNTVAAGSASASGLRLFGSGTGGGVMGGFLYNCTISGNAVGGETAVGGGVGNAGALFNCTVASNTASANTAVTGGGVGSVLGGILYSTLVAGNTVSSAQGNTDDGTDVKGVSSYGHNLIANGSGADPSFGPASNDIIGGNVSDLISPLADNGGPTLTRPQVRQPRDRPGRERP
ncbi:MAG TPA: hypothetical protein VGF55_08305, partial [Gemmataceae bacterium]